LIALRSYLDSSGKLESDYMTLAAVVANEDMWKDFEFNWDKILSEHTPKATYIHMRELVHQADGFDSKLGWNNDNAFALVNKCLIHLSRMDKKRFNMFYCAVDLKAWRKLRSQNYQMPEPIEMCTRYCAEMVIPWYWKNYPGTKDVHRDSIRYFFDRNEYFKHPFENKWNAEVDNAERTGRRSPWQFIKQVSSVDMKYVPGVQAADIVAWAVNRQQTVEHGKKAKYMANIMRDVIPSWKVIWDEGHMRKHFKPFDPIPNK